MYAIVTRRTMNAPKVQETMERAQRDFFPKLKQAPGFRSLTLIQGEEGIVTVVILFESQELAQAFQGEAASWQRTLDELGHRLESMNTGEVRQHVTPGA
jgi:heme-degrading monooxygenase HmoA